MDPSIFKEKYIEIETSILMAKNVLTIGENAGGAEYLKVVLNECDLTISFDIEGKSGGWSVGYWSKDLGLLNNAVNEETGEYEIIRE